MRLESQLSRMNCQRFSTGLSAGHFEAKSAVARPQERKFLGFSFAVGPDTKRTIAPKSLERFKSESERSREGLRASASRRQWQNCPIYAGLARLFRLLRNARGADRSHPLGPVATTVCSLAPVENTTASPSGTDRTASLGAAFEQHGRQRSWPLVYRPERGPLCGALQCSLQIARSPILVRNALAQLLEPPYTDPYVRWCGRGGAERLPPIPINPQRVTPSGTWY